jgi:hypothetical protein
MRPMAFGDKFMARSARHELAVAERGLILSLSKGKAR